MMKLQKHRNSCPRSFVDTNLHSVLFNVVHLIVKNYFASHSTNSSCSHRRQYNAFILCMEIHAFFWIYVTFNIRFSQFTVFNSFNTCFICELKYTIKIKFALKFFNIDIKIIKNGIKQTCENFNERTGVNLNWFISLCVKT